MEDGEVLKGEIGKDKRKEGCESSAISKLSDVRGLDVLAHFTAPSKVNSILRYGILSRRLAVRAGLNIDNNYPLSKDRWVYLNSRNKNFFGGNNYIAFLVRRPSNAQELNSHDVAVPNRLAPRDLIGVAVYGENIQPVLKHKSIWLDKPENALPVYSVETGDLLWPKRMSHEEIVEELRKKGEIQSA